MFDWQVELVCKDQPVPPPQLRCIDQLLVMEAMRWNHLPVAGGLYDQHPDFIDKMKRFMTIRARIENAKQKEETRKMNRTNSAGSGSKRVGRRR